MRELKTVEQCDEFLAFLHAMTLSEREQYKRQWGLKDYFGSDAIMEMINIVTAERDWKALQR